MPHCQNPDCEAHVTCCCVRVFVPKDGDVYGCPCCSTGSELFHGECTSSNSPSEFDPCKKCFPERVEET